VWVDTAENLVHEEYIDRYVVGEAMLNVEEEEDKVHTYVSSHMCSDATLFR
jgi:hypothetical protein